MNGLATSERYTLSLHDALPICVRRTVARTPCSSSAVLNASMEHGVDRKSTRLNSSHVEISYAVFCLKKKNRWFGSGKKHQLTEYGKLNPHHSHMLCV